MRPPTSSPIVWMLAAGSVLVTVLANACGSSSSDGVGGPPGNNDDAAGASSCPPCVTDDDCGGGLCVQLGVDSVCAPACPGGQTDCATAGQTCVPASNVAGQQVSVCVANSDECRGGAPPENDDAGSSPSNGCPGFASPTTASTCASCTGKPNCQTNGCYGGWWCNTATSRCQAQPTSCGSTNTGSFDGGAPVTGTIDANGGTLSRLYFGVVGDTRPPAPDDTAGYPTAVITKIYTSMEAISPKPPFVVGTGDYMFASTHSTQAGAQLDLYLGARAKYSGTGFFPAMGNHECTGATASNCGSGNADGTTIQFTTFLQKMLAPIQKTDPYYTIHVNAADNSWTAKLVFVAANAWTSTQATWLDAELANPTTYTFVVRHESRYANQAPGVTPSEQIMAKHPYTLALVGHTHTYEHFSNSREVVVGNGGAPLTGSKNYGFAIVQQRPDHAIQVDMLDYATSGADASFRFAVNPDGSVAP